MTARLIEATNLTKILCKDLKRSLWYGTVGVARELTGRPRRGTVLRPGEFRALDGVSFTLTEGEALGLVGRNGAGKTTLLRVLGGLLTPDGGRVTVRGRVGALIALGAGFNPLLSGRENIYVNAAILGFNRRQTDARFDAIVDFAELHDSLDAPLHTYSSGMQARLGFAVAAQLEPDILLVDEVLAVGDVTFRAKCYRRINELMAQGTAVILVSHQATMLLSVCTSGLLLERGRVIATGPIVEIVRSYEDNLTGDGSAAVAVPPRPAVSSGELVIDEVRLLGTDGRPVEALETGVAGAIRMRVTATRKFERINAVIVIRSGGAESGPLLFVDAARDGTWLSFAPGVSDVVFEMPMVGLRPGRYRAKLHLERSPLDLVDVIEAFPLQVTCNKPFGAGEFLQAGRWTCSVASDQGSSAAER